MGRKDWDLGSLELVRGQELERCLDVVPFAQLLHDMDIPS